VEINPYLVQLKIYLIVVKHYGGIFDYDLKAERLEEVLRELEDLQFGMIKVVRKPLLKKRQFRKYFRCI
jgi:hypothetical protein